MAWPATALLIWLGLSCGYGFACWLLPPQDRNPLILLCTSLGLSLGLLTTTLFWIAWLVPGRLNLPTSVAAAAVLAVAGLWLGRGRLSPGRFPLPDSFFNIRRDPLQAGLVLAVGLTAGAVLFNATYWPYVDWDTLAIYGPLAKSIYQTGALPDEHFYAAYPMLIPLAYAYTHWASAGLDEYAAKLVPALMALGGVGASGALARAAGNRRSAWLAAGLVALTPIYVRWASSGYTDVPAGLYFVLSALFAYRWLRVSRWQDAALTGLFAGLAMWTKNTGLALLPSLVLLLLLPHSTSVPNHHGRQVNAASQKALMIAVVLAVAGPWYLRNLAVHQALVPPTIWLDQARPTVSSLMVWVDPTRQFGLPGWLFATGLAFGLVQLVLRRRADNIAWTVLAAYIVPFFVAWWLAASYDPRFLVSLVPLLAAGASLMVRELAARRSFRLGEVQRLVGTAIGVLVILVMLVTALDRAVDGKRLILQDPAMDDATKHHLRLGGVYDLALTINQLPVGSRLLGVPPLAVYHLELQRLGAVSLAQAGQPPSAEADSFDYVVYNLGAGQLGPWSLTTSPIHVTDDGYALYPTSPDGPPAGQ
jgi:hypothetical protein